MKIKRDTIAEIAEAVLSNHDAYLVDVQVRGERGESLLQILADTDKGIPIELCARLSREIGARIEELDLVPGRYRLEVSSPGLDKPLRVLRQYVTYTGRNVSVTSVDQGIERADEGVLRGVDGSLVLLEVPDGSIRTIAFENIRECRHRLPW